MNRATRLGLVLSLAATLLSGCLWAVRAPPCPGGFWVDGHYDRWGRFHRAHWRCPGVVEEIIIR